MIGLGVELIFVALAIFGPLLAPYSPTYHGTPGLRPSAQHLFGTTSPFGTDVFSQVLYGVRDSYVVGALGALFAGAVGLVVGFAAGYRGGVLDEILQTVDQRHDLHPAAGPVDRHQRLPHDPWRPFRGCLHRCNRLALGGAGGAGTDLHPAGTRFRRSGAAVGQRAVSIVVKDIAPNMASYIFLVFVLLFASSMLVAVNFDFLGLGPTNGLSLGDIMNQSTLWSALELHMWWWFIPPGAALTLMVPCAVHRQCGPGRSLQPQAEADVSLKVDDLRISYRTLRGDVRAVDGVSFSIADGEIMGLAGESGCGKSTLGNSLIFLEGRMKHVGGTVELDGATLPIADYKAMNRHRLRDVSVIPQYAMSALNPTRKIGRMTADLIKSRGADYRDVLEEFKRRIDLVGLPQNVLNMYPFEMSGGMRQRTTMVISTLLNPSLLIGDEVTSALDVTTQRAVGEMLMEFRDRGFVKSMIVITHDLSVLAQIADTILVMYAGKLAEKASSNTIVDHPLHPYTQLLLGSLPEVGLRYDEAPLTGIPGRPPSLLNPPTGCRFRDRCPFAFDKCVEEPPFVELRPGHEVACWKAMEDNAPASKEPASQGAQS